MKKLRIALGICAFLMLISACGKKGEALENDSDFERLLQDADNALRTQELEKNEYERSMVAQGTDKLAKGLPEKQYASAGAKDFGETGALGAADEEERELTEQELRKLQYSVRWTDNGFFVSTYYRPEEIDWQTVLQGGVGMGVVLSDEQIALIRERMRTERVEAAIEKAIMRGEWEEPEEGEEVKEEPFTEEELALSSGNVTALTLRSIQNFVKSRTGLEYSEARRPLEWPELARNLFYYVPHGSNTVRVEFMKATVRGNHYEIYWRKAVYSKEKKPEYVMHAEVENGKWKFISNLPIDEAEPKTLATIDFYLNKSDALVNWPDEWLELPELPKEEDEIEEEQPSSNKNVKEEPASYMAIITAEQDDCRVCVDRVYAGDMICEELIPKRIFVPGENLANVILQKGEKIGFKVTLEDVPKLRVKVTSGAYYGDYAFGSENRLKRMTKEGVPLPTYVMGRDIAGERRGPEYTSEAELLRLLEGTWLFYDGTMGEYTATLEFSGKQATLKTLIDTYKMEIFAYDRLYVDTRSDPPDVIKLKSTDEETLALFQQHYPYLIRKIGDYRVRAAQKDGELMLMLSFENSGRDGLTALIPGADPLAEELEFYRFTGTVEEENITKENKG